MRSLFLSLVLTLFAQTPLYNPETTREYKGQIVSVQKVSYANRPAPVLQFLLKTERGEIPVEVGPKWYIEANGFSFSPRENVEVQGSLIEIEGRKVIIAKRITTETDVLDLRDEEGSPLWSEWQRKL